MCPPAATPLHLPHLIGPMQHYLWILKTTHSGADMDTSMEMAKGSLDDGLRWTIYDILKNRHALCFWHGVVHRPGYLASRWVLPGDLT